MFQGVKNNDLDLVRYYIKIGVDLNYQHPEYFTSVLVESIRMNNLEMMILLLQNGALPDLHYSCKIGDEVYPENDVANNETLKTSVSIYTDEDKRPFTSDNENTASNRKWQD